MSGLYGNATGGFGIPKMVEIIDGNGNTLVGTVTDSAVVFDATREDVKVGKMFASNDGVQEGIDTKTYRTTVGSEIIKPGENISIPLSQYDQYNYTKFQGVIVIHNSDYSTNVNVVGITIDDYVFSSSTSNKLSTITKNSVTKSIDFNVKNDTQNVYEVFYSTYHEE